MSSEAFGWATATQTFGFAGAVNHFLERVRDRKQPLTSGAEAAKTQQLLDRILSAAGLPVEEQPGRAWSSHAKK
jgi:virulence factor